MSSASGNLVLSVHGLRPMAEDIYFRVKKFIEEQIEPSEEELNSHYANPKTRWVPHPKIEELKVHNFYTFKFRGHPCIKLHLADWEAAGPHICIAILGLYHVQFWNVFLFINSTGEVETITLVTKLYSIVVHIFHNIFTIRDHINVGTATIQLLQH